ncbi:MAG: MFS transporter, partial [Chloroflexota bacterium]|nr:MFS transporter [Chloroflexota bacterium]
MARSLMPGTHVRHPELPRTTLLLAAASFFADISTEMLYPIIPLFLTEVLAAPATILGLVEVFADAIQNIAQGGSGWTASRFRSNKLVALGGYALAAIGKPCIGLAVVWPQFLAARFADRLGAGTRSAPRDALIASSVDEAQRGMAFGMESAGDNLGAVLGPLISLMLVSVWLWDLRGLFLLAFAPAAMAFVMVLLVREPAGNELQPAATVRLRDLPRTFWRYVGATVLFGIGNSTNAFLILRLKQLGFSTPTTILVYAAFNLIAALASLPAGRLSDTVGRRSVLSAGLLIFALAYAGFAVTTNFTILTACFAFYGLYQGTFRTVGKAVASDLVDDGHRALAIGLYASAGGFATLAARSGERCGLQSDPAPRSGMEPPSPPWPVRSFM